MIAAFSLFIISLLGMIIMIILKMAEIRTGRNILSFGHRSDPILEKKIVSTQELLNRWDWGIINSFYHSVLERIENFFFKIIRYFVRKFSKQVKMVKGQGEIPEGNTNNSFFLKNIEEHKNSLNNKPE